MKKFFYLAMALSLVACQTEKVDVGGNVDEVEVNYMYVNLVNNVRGTRADDSQYEDGTEGVNESVVNSVYFYFFDKDKGAFPVEGAKSYVNKVMSGDAQELPNVERILGATVVIEKKKSKDEIPASVVAILNPSGDLLTALTKEDEYDLEDLNKIISSVPLSATDGFVMSSSVYSDEAQEPQQIVVTEIKDENLAATAEAAKMNPVTIYVERTVAKVSLSVVADEVEDLDDNTYDIGVTYEEGGEPKSIYAQFLGWNVTAIANKTNLIKQINPAWSNTLLGSEPWNDILRSRSYWAINPTLTYPADYEYKKFEAADEDNDDYIKAFAADGNNFTYLLENAADGSDNAAYTKHPSQVIIYARLVDGEGNPLTVAEYAGVKYYGTNAENVENKVKTIFAGYIQSAGYKKYKREGGSITVGDIEVDDILLRTAWADKAGDEEKTETTPPESGRYYVYAYVDSAPKDYDGWTTNENATSFAEENIVDASKVNDELNKYGRAKIWRTGYTYYYFNIRHLNNSPEIPTAPKADDPAYKTKLAAYNAALEEAGEEPGFYGVVRNHVYQSKINSIVGLGTPVFDPNETIYPEKPEEDEIILAAEIKILSWRIVENGYDLVW